MATLGTRLASCDEHATKSEWGALSDGKLSQSLDALLVETLNYTKLYQ
jgi:hypothetical protein